MDTLFYLCSPGLHPDNQPVENVYHLLFHIHLEGRVPTETNVQFHSVYGCLAIVSSGNEILTSITTLDNAGDHNLNYLNI